MSRAIFICPDGSRHEVEVPDGTSLMRAACDNGIAGVVGDCGGAMTCATCHVFVDEDYLDRLVPMAPAEDQMLDFVAAQRQPNSRLSCQVVMRQQLDGIVVRVADPQT